MTSIISAASYDWKILTRIGGEVVEQFFDIEVGHAKLTFRVDST